MKVKRLIQFCFFFAVIFQAFWAFGQNSARENDSIFEVLAKSIVTKMNVDPSSAIPDAEAFVTFSDTNHCRLSYKVWSLPASPYTNRPTTTSNHSGRYSSDTP